MRVPSGEPELVRAGAAGDPAAVAALWDAYGARAFAFSQRILGRAELAADAAQDAFLLAQAQLPRLARSGESFGPVLLSAARTTSYELLAREEHADAGRQAGPGLSAAVSRLRPQQRAALALAGLEGLSYAEIAPILGIGAEAVPALLARARLRLHDELHGTALAAAAVRAPDCEDVLPLLAAGADGELAAGEAAWAEPHVTRCETCPRTRRALEDAAATYAAWSPAVPPSWLRTATLAEVGAEAVGAAPASAATGPPPPRLAGRRAAGTWATPRPSLAAALMGATLLSVAFASLLLATVGSLRQGGSPTGGTRMPDGTRSLQVAAVPERRTTHRAPSHRTARRARRARHAQRPRHVSAVRVRAITRRTPAATPRRTSTPAPAQPKRRASKPRPTPKRSQPTTTAAPAAPPPPLTPANPDAPADEPPNASDGGSTTAAPASTSPTASVPSASTPAKVATTPPVSAPAVSAPGYTGRDDDNGGGGQKPCSRPHRSSRRSHRH